MKAALPLIVLAVFFLASAYFAEAYTEELTSFIGTGVSGILVYIGLAALGTVIAPLSSLPFMPLATALWGPVVAALASQVGWGIGGVIAFALSRTYGRPLVERIISRERLARAEKRIPRERQFWSIALLSMTLPTDVVSYTLGLFRNVRWRTYVPAMLLGNMPFSFVFAYTGALPFGYQAALVPVVVLIVLLWSARKPASVAQP